MNITVTRVPWAGFRARSSSGPRYCAKALERSTTRSPHLHPRRKRFTIRDSRMCILTFGSKLPVRAIRRCAPTRNWLWRTSALAGRILVSRTKQRRRVLLRKLNRSRPASLIASKCGSEHYLVHAFESIGHPEEAVKHGEIYARLCPSVPHAQHMYGHDLRITGRNDEAIAQFRKANALELSYYESEKIPARYDWHRIHNLDLLAGSYEFKGQVKQAEELLREFFSLPANDGLFASYQGDWPRFLLSRGRYAEALSAAGQMTEGKFPLQRAMGHLFAGRALVALNRADEAQQELAKAEKESENVPESDPEPLMPQPRHVLEGQRNILRGEIALRKGNTAEANAQLNEVLSGFVVAKGSGDAVNYLFTMLYIAKQACSADDWDLAETAAKQMLVFDPSYAGGHYVAAVVAEHKGDSATARKELTAAEKLWGQADPELSEIIDVHKKLAGTRQMAERP